MKKNSIIIGTYNFLPEGTSPKELEVVYQNSYKPFLMTLNTYTDICAVVFYSGSLLNWIQEKHPEFIVLLSEMINRKQVEMISGGYNTPLFPLIPQRDRIGQIEAHSTLVRKIFKKKSLGVWLPDYAWEQSFANTLKTAGYAYTFLSDIQFKAAGLSIHEAQYPIITEDQGNCITVFPILESLIHSYPPFSQEIITNIIHGNTNNTVSCLFFSGESLTLNTLASEQTISSFFDIILEHKKVLEVQLPSRILKNLHGFKTVYFPDSTSLFCSCKLTNTDLPVAPIVKIKKHVQEAHLIAPVSPRMIISSNFEASHLYSKMHYVHISVNQNKTDKARKKNATDALWKAQCSSFYFYPDCTQQTKLELRANAYKFLLEAEKSSRDTITFLPSLISSDFNFDGEPEYMLQTNEFDAYVSSQGASLFELDDLTRYKNYIDIFLPKFSRPYHSFTDTILIEQQNQKKLPPHEIDLSKVLFTPTEITKNPPSIEFQKELNYDFMSQNNFNCLLSKTISAKKGELQYRYVLSKLQKNRNTMHLVITSNFIFPEHASTKCTVQYSSEIIEQSITDYFEIQGAESILFDNGKKSFLKISVAPPAIVKVYPVFVDDILRSSKVVFEYNIPSKIEEFTASIIVSLHN